MIFYRLYISKNNGIDHIDTDKEEEEKERGDGRGTVDRIVPLWKMRRRISLPGKSHFLGSPAVPPVYSASSSIISILACLRCVVLQQRAA